MSGTVGKIVYKMINYTGKIETCPMIILLVLIHCLFGEESELFTQEKCCFFF